MTKVKLANYFDPFSYIVDYCYPVKQMKGWNKRHAEDAMHDMHYEWSSRAVNELRYMLERPFSIDGSMDKVTQTTYRYDSIDLHDACLNAAAFSIGSWPCNPMMAVNYFVESLSDSDREEFFHMITCMHHQWNIKTAVELKWSLFGNFFYETCPLYKAYSTEHERGLVDLANVGFQLTDNKAMYLVYLTYLYSLPKERMPHMWCNLRDYIVPSTNEPFRVTKNHKNVVIITDGAVTIKLKLLSDRNHMVMMAEYRNGQTPEDGSFIIALDKRADPKQSGFLFTECEQPHLYSLNSFAFDTPGYCTGPCRLIYKQQMKSVKFSF